jgi:L-2-hydroxycarboxylate dehydrogenase (NAD+)
MEYILPVDTHNAIVVAAYQKRGYTQQEGEQVAHYCQLASWHGIRTHNAIKALHLDHLFGTGANPPGSTPGAVIEKLPSKFKAAQVWKGNDKVGQAVAAEAFDTCMKLADEYGVGMVSVDSAFHYLWGGGYVIDVAKKGYIAYTNCTATLAEVVPFGGKYPTCGTNPHSWGLPTTDAVGFPIVIDWATSTVAMGKVQALKREGKSLPPNSAIDKDGNMTTDPDQVAALLPFGAHKGYGLSLLNELYAAFTGGSLPTIRYHPELASPGEKQRTCQFFQVMHPEALSSGDFACGRSQAENVKAVLDDILGHGNSPPEGRAILPGQIEHEAALRSEKAGGLIITEAERQAFKEVADEAGVAFDPNSLAKAP